MKLVIAKFSTEFDHLQKNSFKAVLVVFNQRMVTAAILPVIFLFSPIVFTIAVRVYLDIRLWYAHLRDPTSYAKELVCSRDSALA